MRTRISPAFATAGGLTLAASMALGITVAAAMGAAQAKPPAKPPAKPTPAPAAASVERFSTPASYRAPAGQGHGYSARSRHMADCLATYRHYDPETDRVLVRPGVSRRCGL